MAENDNWLREWVREQLEEGVSPELIKETLAEEGHDPSIVNEILKPSAEAKPPTEAKPSEARPVGEKAMEPSGKKPEGKGLGEKIAGIFKKILRIKQEEKAIKPSGYMPEEEGLRKKVKEELEEGIDPELIKKILAEEGHDPSIVDEVLKGVAEAEHRTNVKLPEGMNGGKNIKAFGRSIPERKTDGIFRKTLGEELKEKLTRGISLRARLKGKTIKHLQKKLPILKLGVKLPTLPRVKIPKLAIIEKIKLDKYFKSTGEKMMLSLAVILGIVIVGIVFVNYFSLAFSWPQSLKNLYTNLHHFNNSEITVEGTVFSESVPGQEGIPFYVESGGFLIPIYVRNTSRFYNEGEVIRIEGVVRVRNNLFIETTKDEYLGYNPITERDIKYHPVSKEELKNPEKLWGRLITIKNLTVKNFFKTNEIKVFNETYFVYKMEFEEEYLPNFYFGPPLQIEENKPYDIFAAVLYLVPQISGGYGYTLKIFDLV